jgi:hypothetical protein
MKWGLRWADMNKNSGHVTTKLTCNVEDQYQNFKQFHMQANDTRETKMVKY